jgi:hypothetical protein
MAFVLSTFALIVVFREAQGRRGILAFLRFLPMMLAFLMFTLGLCLHNAIAAFEGWFGGPSAFVRTPKYGIVGAAGEWAGTPYASRKLARIVWFEMALLVLVAAGIAAGWRRGDFSVYAIEVPTVFGLAWSIGLSVWHVAQARTTDADVSSQRRNAVIAVSRDHVKEARRAVR